jgi:hypothetical protein
MLSIFPSPAKLSLAGKIVNLFLQCTLSLFIMLSNQVNVDSSTISTLYNYEFLILFFYFSFDVESGISPGRSPLDGYPGLVLQVNSFFIKLWNDLNTSAAR